MVLPAVASRILCRPTGGLREAGIRRVNAPDGALRGRRSLRDFYWASRGAPYGRKPNFVSTNGRTTRSGNKAWERPGRAPCAGGGHFVTFIGLRVALPTVASRILCRPTGGLREAVIGRVNGPGGRCAWGGHFVTCIELRVVFPMVANRICVDQRRTEQSGKRSLRLD